MYNATLIPRAGMIVLYAITAEHVKQINGERATARAQRRFTDARGNSVEAGDVYPMLITRAWGNSPGSAVNGTVFLDGPNETLWVTSASEGEGPGYYQFQEEATPEPNEDKPEQENDPGRVVPHHGSGPDDVHAGGAKRKKKR